MANPSVKEIIVDSRISKVLALRTDSSAMLEALNSISEFYVSNTVEARRGLRNDLELHNITLAKKFLQEFDQVRERIENIEDSSSKLQVSCQEIALKISSANKNMKMFMEKASELENRRNFVLEKSKEIEIFLNRFQLSSEEINILYEIPIESSSTARSFFKALQRLQVAYGDCKAMVEKQCHSSGFELLDSLGEHQDAAYARLFEWVKTQCSYQADQKMVTDDNDSLLQTAVRYLRKLPIYFDQCQDLIILSRRSLLVQRFILALTQGGTTGQPFRAIDLHAHDAIRYVGDMLAWMHQAVASEQEFLQSVFGKPTQSLGQSNSSNQTQTQIQTDAAHAENVSDEKLAGMAMEDMLARCLQGLGRPLRVRIIQTLESRAGLGVLYTLTDLLNFYEITFSKIMSVENSVHSAVKGCLLECKRLFVNHLNKQADTLSQTAGTYPLDLTASPTTKDCCKQIQEILRVNTSALSSLPFDNEDECYIDNVVGSIVQPLLQACRLTSQSLPPSETAIFMLNNISAIQYEIADAYSKEDKSGVSTRVNSEGDEIAWRGLLKTELKAWLDIFVREELSTMLRRSDMDKIIDLIDVLPSGFVASTQVGLSPDRVGIVLRAFYSSLFSTLAPQYERLQDPELREVARRESALAVASAYKRVFDVIALPSNGYDTGAILTHTHEEVRVLLGCD